MKTDAEVQLLNLEIQRRKALAFDQVVLREQLMREAGECAGRVRELQQGIADLEATRDDRPPANGG